MTNPTPEQMAMEAVFWSKVSIGDDSECWEFQGSRSDGYGRFYYKGSVMRAHRFAYSLVGSEIPPDLVIDHTCRNRACCNPAHLRAVTNAVNVMENSASSCARYAQRTHCAKGHPLTGGNLKIERHRPKTRLCRACAIERSRQWRSRRAAALRAGEHLK